MSWKVLEGRYASPALDRDNKTVVVSLLLMLLYALSWRVALTEHACLLDGTKKIFKKLFLKIVMY